MKLLATLNSVCLLLHTFLDLLEPWFVQTIDQTVYITLTARQDVNIGPWSLPTNGRMIASLNYSYASFSFFSFLYYGSFAGMISVRFEQFFLVFTVHFEFAILVRSFKMLENEMMNAKLKPLYCLCKHVSVSVLYNTVVFIVMLESKLSKKKLNDDNIEGMSKCQVQPPKHLTNLPSLKDSRM